MLQRIGRTFVVLVVFAVATYVALEFGVGGLWRGFEAAHAVATPNRAHAPYELTRLTAVMPTLETIRKQYVDPARVEPRQMFLSALNEVQRDVAQVIILHDEKSPSVRVRVYDQEREFRVDNVQGPWDVAARLREVFAFLQDRLKDTEVDLREVEYAACNGMLRTLDPHSVFMSPEAYREMNLSTAGHFGGLGIVISIRDQMLTIMRPMPGTPAGQAGLKRFDRIEKINNESTLNMPLDDAVARLRGKPGTKVTVWIRREGSGGWQGTRPFELTREVIRIKSVDSRSLGNGVGYVRIKQFQSSTSDELEEALGVLGAKHEIKGLVLDLRGNPGGLLDQAAQVADRFLEHGVIVATVGHSEGREEKSAEPQGTEPAYPVVVLTNNASASASEIVTGALKNHDRAVVVGQRTFGKGTVQLVFPRITPDGAALKLTIAKYLTPGDFSIQGVGVTPDVELDPMTADPLEMDLFRSDGFSERDLSKSLEAGTKRSPERPFFKLRYNLPEAERAAIRELGGEIDDEFRLDFPVQFARDFVRQLPRAARDVQLQRSKQFLDQQQQTQIAAVTADLARLGVNWSPPPDDFHGPSARQLSVRVETDRPGNTVEAGAPMTLRVAVTNQGTEPVYQLRAVTKSDNGYFDEKELAFGKIEPGETVRAAAPLGWCEIEGRRPGSTKPLPENAKRACRIPSNAVTREDVIQVRFHSEGGDPPRDAEIRVTVRSLSRPVFAYSYQVLDDRPGNGDGHLTRGEGATVRLTVKNVGRGSAHETQANLRNLTGAGLLLKDGRFDVSDMKPGDIRDVAFTFDVLPALSEKFVKVELSVVDRDLGVISNEKVTLPVARSGTFVREAEGDVAVEAEGVDVREQPAASGRVVGRLPGGAVVERMGVCGEYTKVEIGQNRFGFVSTAQLSNATKPPAGTFEPLLTRSPPVLEVKTGALSTRRDHITVEGVATDPDGVLDLYVFVGGDKVFYESSPKGTKRDRLGFKFEAKLGPGTNVITVVARENEDTATRYTRIVRRDGPQGEVLPTPERELFGADWEFSPPGE